METIFEAFEIITQRPDKNLTVRNAKCPFCKSEKHQTHGTRTTLLGIDSMNHKWHERTCKDCGKNYTVENKGRNVWITDEKGNVMHGMPSCFEHYIYDCKCGGKVERHYTDMDGKPVNGLSSSNESGKWVKHYKTFYKCNKCNTEIQTEHDYFHS